MQRVQHLPIQYEKVRHILAERGTTKRRLVPMGFEFVAPGAFISMHLGSC